MRILFAATLYYIRSAMITGPTKGIVMNHTTVLTSKQRAYLRGLANSLEPIFQLGKGGISHNFIAQIDEALEARELIKISLLETAGEPAREAAESICQQTGAQSVQVIGRKLVLYREAKEEEKRTIALPK